MNDQVKLHRFTGLSPAWIENVFEVRRQVFIVEQNVEEEEEFDAFESTSTHFAACIEKKVVGTARWRETDHGIKLERFAVLASFRGKGIGHALLDRMLEDVRKLDQPIYLHAQLGVLPFYERRNFVREGELFEECGIQHYKMILSNT